MRAVIFLNVVVFSSFGCVIKSAQDPRFPVKLLQDGRKVVAYTDESWQYRISVIEEDIAAQKRGEPIYDGGGPGSRRDYRGYWKNQRIALKRYAENYRKYIEYIDKRLSEEGL